MQGGCSFFLPAPSGIGEKNLHHWWHLPGQGCEAAGTGNAGSFPDITRQRYSSRMNREKGG